MILRWSSYVALIPPKGRLKRKTAVFRVLSHFAWRNCCKVTLCENCQRQSCKAFIGLSICAKIGGDVPLNVNFALSEPFHRRVNRADQRFQEIRRILLLASKLLQWNMKLLTMFINWTNCAVFMHYTIAD